MPVIHSPNDEQQQPVDVPPNAFRVLVTGFGVSLTGPSLAFTRDKECLQGHSALTFSP